ncbi:MAG: NAD(P)-binding domain-containing protein [Alphaproteobacteria bacterium]|nr:NAD(P)-binding domain-containing protein [Alphaproteobacteria bacterium]
MANGGGRGHLTGRDINLPCTSAALPHKVRGNERKGQDMSIQSVGIVGAGQMGNGIAHVFAAAGYDVLMTDISAGSLEKAQEIIGANLARQVSRGKLS